MCQKTVFTISRVIACESNAFFWKASLASKEWVFRGSVGSPSGTSRWTCVHGTSLWVICLGEPCNKWKEFGDPIWGWDKKLRRGCFYESWPTYLFWCLFIWENLYLASLRIINQFCRGEFKNRAAKDSSSRPAVALSGNMQGRVCHLGATSFQYYVFSPRFYGRSRSNPTAFGDMARAILAGNLGLNSCEIQYSLGSSIKCQKKMAEAILKMRTWYNNIIFDLTTDSCRNNLVIPFNTSNQVVSAAAINSPVGWPPGEAPHANRRSCGAQRRIPRIWSTWVRQVNAVVQWGICQFFGH